MSQKEIFDTGRRSAISTSEFGLYTDRVDGYRSNLYNNIVRKFVIGVMVVIAVILVAIFLYDFTSATSANSKVNQDTKHIYILQNALRKSVNVSRKSTNHTAVPQLIVDKTNESFMQDRSDIEGQEDLRNRKIADHGFDENYTHDEQSINPEFRTQNLNNFKLRKRVLKSLEHEKSDREEEEAEGKQLFDNHAVIYRVRQRFKRPDSEEESSSEEIRPAPFRWEYKTPYPTSFKRPRYPQLSQYRYPQSSKNIQDIIKYLANSEELPNKGIKFAGVYINPKKYDVYPELGEIMSNSDRSEEEENPPYSISYNGDPFYQYKPKHPSDVNLLAPNNVRFSPVGVHRYNPYYDPFYLRPGINYNKPTILPESQYDSVGSYTAGNNGKKKKPKPFSVMLDIYPITDIAEQNKKSSRPKPQMGPEDYDFRRPMQFNRGPKFYSSVPSVPIVSLPGQQSLSDEEERQQMIFHLNLYPKRKSKINRHDIISKSGSMLPEDRQQFVERIMSPLESIAKHLNAQSIIDDSKYEETETADTTIFPLVRYQETLLDYKKDNPQNEPHLYKEHSLNFRIDDKSSDEVVSVPSNHRVTGEEDYPITGKYEYEAQKIVMTTTTESECNDCNNTTTVSDASITDKNVTKDVDMIEGFQLFDKQAEH